MSNAIKIKTRFRENCAKKELLKELILASIVQILVDVKQPKLIRNFVSTLGSNLILLIEAIYQSSS